MKSPWKLLTGLVSRRPPEGEAAIEPETVDETAYENNVRAQSAPLPAPVQTSHRSGQDEPDNLEFKAADESNSELTLPQPEPSADPGNETQTPIEADSQPSKSDAQERPQLVHDT